jgi:integrase
MPIAPGSAYTKLKDILAEADLPDMRFHDLRHTFATHAAASGIDPRTLAGLLGHTKPSFTLDAYTHVTTDMQRNASGIVGNFITDMFGEELKPWQESENQETAQ